MPSADQVARAFVAAAKLTGETASLKAAAAVDRPLNAMTLRARWIAAGALRELFPEIGWKGLAPLVGCASASALQVGYGHARSTPRWREADVGVVVAAI